jgi:hypothetical protein
MDNETLIELAERIAVLETKFGITETNLSEINKKLDELLHLKSKGMGALWFVGILVSSGVLGIVAAVMSIFGGKPHG